MLVSNAEAENFDDFVRNYKAVFEMPLDRLEEFMMLRNALAAKRNDEFEDKIKKP